MIAASSEKIFRPQPGQQEAFSASFADIVFFGGAAGGGKVQPYSSKVLCADRSWKLLGDLQVGDELLNPDGSAQRVIKIFPHQGVAFFKIVMKDGGYTYAHSEHLWGYSLNPFPEYGNGGADWNRSYLCHSMVGTTKDIATSLQTGCSVYLPTVAWSTERSRQIAAIEQGFVSDGCCILVDHPNHLYVTDDFIVTHNTFAELIEQLRHINNPRFIGVIFRREAAQINDPGGLLDASQQIYPYFGGVYMKGIRMWLFPEGSKVAFRHINDDAMLDKYQGSEIALIEFDELTHFSERSFFYLMSRNRSTCGIRPYMRATMNPEPDSWVRQFIDWWIDERGFIDNAKSGVVRYFCRVEGEVQWASSRKELYRKNMGLYRAYKRTGVHTVKSFTFIKSSIWDNKALMTVNPDYLANLMALPLIDRMTLLEGNWDARPSAGMIFNQRWFESIEPNELPFDMSKPSKGVLIGRFWDFAGTEEEIFGSKKTKNEPCYTVGCKMAYYAPWKSYIILHVFRARIGAAGLDDEVLKWARLDGRHVQVVWEQEPGSSGIRDTWRLKTHLQGFNAEGIQPQGDKLSRAKPMSAANEKRKIIVLQGAWNDDFLSEAHNFPEYKFKDQVDAATLGYNWLFDRVSRGFGAQSIPTGTGTVYA